MNRAQAFEGISGRWRTNRPILRATCFLAMLTLIHCFTGCFGCFVARAQEAQADMYARFEGKNVSRIEISTGTTAPADAFRSLLKQKENAPFSGADIRASVAALQATQQFAKVQVKVVPEAAGLDVQFVLEPSYYVGIASFPGAPGEFVYTRLLQAVNIPEQSPFFEDLLPEGQKALEQFLKVQGYFTAKVEPTVDKDEDHKIANLVFQIHAGPRAKIGDIDIQGISNSRGDAYPRVTSFFLGAREARVAEAGAAILTGPNRQGTRLHSRTSAQ